MFGKNKVSGPFNESGANLLINEIFYTIQGEGPDAGSPAVFVRLSKCNLRCYFCDTEFETGQDIELSAILDRVLSLAKPVKCDLVVITGGEPLLQNIVPLVKLLNDFGLACSVETAGTMYYPNLTQVFDAMRNKNGNLIVCSPKTPKVHPQIEQLVGAWKYVIKAGETDGGVPAGSTQRPGEISRAFKPEHPAVPIYVQPMDEGDDAANKANLEWAVDVAMQNGWRLGVQIHKIAGLR